MRYMFLFIMIMILYSSTYGASAFVRTAGRQLPNRTFQRARLFSSEQTPLPDWGPPVIKSVCAGFAGGFCGSLLGLGGAIAVQVGDLDSCMNAGYYLGVYGGLRAVKTPRQYALLVAGGAAVVGLVRSSSKTEE